MKKYQLTLAGVKVFVTHKKVRNLNLRVSLHDAKVTLSVPTRASERRVYDFIFAKIDWIKKAQEKLRGLKHFSKQKFLEGEKHYFFDEEYILQILETTGKTRVEIEGDKLKLLIKKDFTLAKKKKLLDEFYRSELKKIIPQLIAKWEEKTGLKVLQFGIKKMKTRWGTCNIRAKKIWLNLDLAKRPLRCLEYIIVHEMVHLWERKHNKKFFSHMDRLMPEWKQYKDELKK